MNKNQIVALIATTAALAVSGQAVAGAPNPVSTNPVLAALKAQSIKAEKCVGGVELASTPVGFTVAFPSGHAVALGFNASASSAQSSLPRSPIENSPSYVIGTTTVAWWPAHGSSSATIKPTKSETSMVATCVGKLSA